MRTNLTFGEKLADLRLKNGYSTFESLEKALKHRISSSTLSNYEKIENTDKDISAFNVAILANFYGVSTDYLLGLTDQPERTKNEYDELHLTDKMIEILKDKSINHLLLSELLTHPDFKRFIVDSEVYVDQVASTSFGYANSIMDYARDIVTDKTGDETYLTERTIELSHLDPDKFVIFQVKEDIEIILKDIKEKHKKDESTVNLEEEMKTFKNQMDDTRKIVMKQTPTSDDDCVTLFCTLFKVKEALIPPEERKALVSFFRRSPTLRKAKNQRGKKKKKSQINC